jgi:hypothetical protein
VSSIEYDCGIARRLEKNDSKEQEVIRRYLSLQIDASFEEPGDQIDLDYNRFADILAGMDLTEDERISFGGVRTVVANCLESRYMGVCAINNCSGKGISEGLIQSIVKVKL